MKSRCFSKETSNLRVSFPSSYLSIKINASKFGFLIWSPIQTWIDFYVLIWCQLKSTILYQAILSFKLLAIQLQLFYAKLQTPFKNETIKKGLKVLYFKLNFPYFSSFVLVTEPIRSNPDFEIDGQLINQIRKIYSLPFTIKKLLWKFPLRYNYYLNKLMTSLKGYPKYQ